MFGSRNGVIIRSNLIQSDSVNQKVPFLTFSDWTFFRLGSSGPPSHHQSSRFCSLYSLSGNGWCEGVLLYGSQKSVGSSVLRAFYARNACFARDEPSSKRVGRVGGVGLGRKPPKLRSWRCTRPRAAKATAGVAVVGKMASIPRATAIVLLLLLLLSH